MTLYQIEQEQREIVDALLESEGVITPELEARMVLTRENLQQKAVGYALAIKENAADLGKINDAIADLQKKKRAIEATSDRLKERILAGLQLFGVEKIKDVIVSIWIKRSKALSILDEQLIPDEFRITVEQTTVDKNALKAAIEGGLKTEGAVIIENQNLQVR